MRRGVHGIDLHPSAATPSVSPNRRFLCGFSARAADANFSAALRPRTPMIEPSRFIILARSPRSSPSSLPPSPSFSISRRKRWKETAKPIESLTTMIGNGGRCKSLMDPRSKQIPCARHKSVECRWKKGSPNKAIAR